MHLFVIYLTEERVKFVIESLLSLRQLLEYRLLAPVMVPTLVSLAGITDQF